MTTQSNRSLILSKFIPQLCSLIVTGTGALAMVGWLMEWRTLTSIWADYIPMAPNSAISFIILGISFYAFLTKSRLGLILSRFGAAMVFVLSLIRFTEYNAHIDLHVDQWFFNVPSGVLGHIPVGQMAMPTAINFIFATITLFLAASLKRHWTVNILIRTLALVTAFIGLALCLAYIYDAPLLYGGTTIPMALNSAIAFSIIGLGLFVNNVGYEIAERKQAVKALIKTNDELENRVQERTMELAKTNEALQSKIIEHKNTEEALRKSAERFRSIVEWNFDAIHLLDTEGRFTYSSSSVERITGYKPDDITGKHFNYFIAKTDIPKASKAFYDMRNGKIMVMVELEAKKKDGTPFTIEANGSPIFKDGQITDIQVVYRDITEKKMLAEQLRQSQKMEAIGQLAGGIAHDFNNILTAIIGYGSLLLKKNPNDNLIKEYAGEIITSSNRAAALTRDLLTFSRKHTINPQPALLSELIKTVVRLLARVLGEHIELKVKIADENLIVKMDVPQLEHVFLNLATNARDAMPKGGKLTIDVSQVNLDKEFIGAHHYGIKGQYALITFTDTGIGMDKNIQSRIFEPFFTTKSVGKGTGLGLSMVYGAIKQHKGYINVYSEPRHGTVFKIYLPLSEDVTLDKKMELAEVAAPKGNGETILLAEDNPDTRKTIKAVLEEYNYKVIEAVDGGEAINKFMEKKDKIDLLILDTIMPKVSGKQVYEGIKNIDPTIKAIFISGYTADMIKAEDLLETGFELLSKPIMPDKLLIKIREVLSK